MTGDMIASAYLTILIQQGLEWDLIFGKKPQYRFLLFLDANEQHFERLVLIAFFET